MAFFLQILAVVVAPLIFIIGLVKPNWILFWMKEPSRLWSTTVALLLFMGSFTAWSEIRMGHRSPQLTEREMEHQNELKEKQKQDQRRQRRDPEQENELKLNRM